MPRSRGIPDVKAQVTLSGASEVVVKDVSGLERTLKGADTRQVTMWQNKPNELLLGWSDKDHSMQGTVLRFAGGGFEFSLASESIPENSKE